MRLILKILVCLKLCYNLAPGHWLITQILIFFSYIATHILGYIQEKTKYFKFPALYFLSHINHCIYISSLPLSFQIPRPSQVLTRLQTHKSSLWIFEVYTEGKDDILSRMQCSGHITNSCSPKFLLHHAAILALWCFPL